MSTLAKFGATVDVLKPRIFVLLRRCLFDSDDEVLDRATKLKTLGSDSYAVETGEDVKEFLFGSLDVLLTNLERSLKNYNPNKKINKKGDNTQTIGQLIEYGLEEDSVTQWFMARQLETSRVNCHISEECTDSSDEMQRRRQPPNF